MGVEHLQGKRTGRPRGSKSRPWVRALGWAYRNMDKPDAEPPTPLAARLLALARADMAAFLRCLAALEAGMEPSAAPTPPMVKTVCTRCRNARRAGR